MRSRVTHDKANVSEIYQNDPNKKLSSLRDHDLVSKLHATIGNNRVQQLYQKGSIQAKLKVGQPNDKYEQEADRVAEYVVHMKDPQRQKENEGAVINGNDKAVQVDERVTPGMFRKVNDEPVRIPISKKIRTIIRKLPAKSHLSKAIHLRLQLSLKLLKEYKKKQGKGGIFMLAANEFFTKMVLKHFLGDLAYFLSGKSEKEIDTLNIDVKRYLKGGGTTYTGQWEGGTLETGLVDEDFQVLSANAIKDLQELEEILHRYAALAKKSIRGPEWELIIPKSKIVEEQGKEAEKSLLEGFVQPKSNSNQTRLISHSLGKNFNPSVKKGVFVAESVRNYFEHRMGHNFSKVRVHKDTNAAKYAKALNARAFTIGQNIFFNSGQYQPKNVEGKKLLAHELTHVVQQSNGLQASQSNPIIQRAMLPNVSKSLKIFPAREPTGKQFSNGFSAVIFFGRGRSFLDQANMQAIEGVGLILSLLKGAHISVFAHASTESGTEFNQNLSEQRMETVVNLLQYYSLHKLNIYKKAFGETEPIVDETGVGDELEQNRQWNRRVHINVIKPPQDLILFPPLTEPTDQNIIGAPAPEIPSFYKQLESNFNKLKDNPYVQHFIAPTLDEIIEQKGFMIGVGGKL